MSNSFCARSLRRSFCFAYSCTSIGCGRFVKPTSRSIGIAARPMPPKRTKKNQPTKEIIAIR